MPSVSTTTTITTFSSSLHFSWNYTIFNNAGIAFEIVPPRFVVCTNPTHKYVDIYMLINVLVFFFVVKKNEKIL